MAEYFGDLLPRVLSRRTVLKTALFGAAGLTLATLTKGCATAPGFRLSNDLPQHRR